MKNRQNIKRTDKGDEDMATITKPNNRAFTLQADKVEQFLSQKSQTKKVMDRFFAHKPKDGVKTPLKGKNV